MTAETDFLGNPVTGATPTQLAAIDDFVGGLISYDARLDHVPARADLQPDRTPVLPVRNLAHGYGPHLVLDGIDLDIHAGEIVGLADRVWRLADGRLMPTLQPHREQ